jgi:hypothetical protein
MEKSLQLEEPDQKQVDTVKMVLSIARAAPA